MSNKRVREEESMSGGGGGGGGPAKANQFGEWLLENIYKYAEVRDSDGLAKLRGDYEDLNKRFQDLLDYMRAWGFGINFGSFCTGCGNTRVKEQRTTCDSCNDVYISCSTCGPTLCRSGRHRICFRCALRKEDCDGFYPNRCSRDDDDDD